MFCGIILVRNMEDGNLMILIVILEENTVHLIQVINLKNYKIFQDGEGVLTGRNIVGEDLN